ncbi:MAG: aminotransferase class V-fold PLP-dependent enzyme [Bacteroidia bacterium]
MKSLFLLQNDITYFNFGSFGACPKEIFDDYIQWQYLLENEPVQFIAINGPGYVKKSREALAKFIHCEAEDLVFVPSPTVAVNIIAKNFLLKAGDEILSTDLEYGACERTWNYYCKHSGAGYVQQKINLPIISKEAFIEDFWKGYSEKTKAVFISHITSSTGLIFPVKEICAEAKKRGLITIVDGAHVPGHIDLDLSSLQADFYTGACHKWMMTPKGSSFLFARKEFQNQLDPLIVSWGYESVAPSGSQFFDYHQFNGTRDFSAYLTIPKSIDFMQRHDWKNISRQCKQQVLDAAPEFYEVLGTQALAPLTHEFYGQMCSAQVNTTQPEQLQRHLFEQYKIEIPVMRHREKCFIRISFHAFNTDEELKYLFDSLKKIKKETNLIERN